MAINKNLTLNFEAVNDYPPIRDSIRTEISDSQVSKNIIPLITVRCYSMLYKQ